MDHFRLVAPVYDRLFYFADPSRILDLLASPAGGRILDVGGGTGRVAQALRSSMRTVVVLDESADMLGHARLKGLPALCGRAERLPWADGSFERILLVDSLHHLQDQRRAAAELMRALAPGGRIVVEEPNVERWAARLIAVGEKLLRMRSHFLAPAAVAALFSQAGGHVHVERDGATFWAVIQKPASAAA